MRKIFIKAFLLSFVLLNVLPFLSNTVQASPDIITQNPQSNSGSRFWLNPANAYTSNDDYALCSANGATRMYYDYNFDTALPDGSTIEKVEVGVEHYETETNRIRVRISVDGGDSWSGWASLQSESEVLDWVDATSLTEWTKDKLTDENLRVEVEYLTSGTGCFSGNTLVTMSNYEYETIDGLKKGDKLLAYGDKQQVVTEYTEHEDMLPTLFYNVTTIENRSLVVWGGHMIPISPFLETKLVQNLTLGDRLLKQNGMMVDILSIETLYLTEFYNIIVSNGLFYAEEILIHNAIKEPWTTYLDWLPVRVTYSVEEEEEELWDCSYIGLNSTLAESISELSANWEDLNASKDLDKFLFSWNNTGTIENSTWLDTWDGNWSRTVQTLNSTVGLTIAFRFFVKDSVGVEYPSSICFFTTEEPSGFNWFTIVVILGVVCFLAIVFALTKT